MSVQGDLLEKSGSHDQDVVSKQKMILGAVSVFAGTALLVLLLAGASRLSINSHLKRVRQELAQLRPPAAKLRTAQAAITANRDKLSEFKDWSTVRSMPMYQILRSAQEDIPSQMVLYHFSTAIEPSGEQNSPVCTLYISGVADDEETVIAAKRQLNTDPRLRGFCGEVKLATSQRYSGKSWAFALEGRRVSGGAK